MRLALDRDAGRLSPGSCLIALWSERAPRSETLPLCFRHPQKLGQDQLWRGRGPESKRELGFLRSGLGENKMLVVAGALATIGIGSDQWREVDVNLTVTAGVAFDAKVGLP